MRRHDLDWVSLVAGVVFAALALAYLVSPLVHTSVDARYVWPVLLVVLGGGGLGAAVRANAREEREFASFDAAADTDLTSPRA